MSVLIICEKPSVAKTVALALGAAEQKDGYLSGDGLLVSWCIGHLISMADAGSYDERYLWFSRPNGTHCLRERDVFLRGTREHNTFRFYHEQTKERVLAYAVVLSGMESGKVKGSIYELDYATKAELAIQTALRTDNTVLGSNIGLVGVVGLVVGINNSRLGVIHAILSLIHIKQITSIGHLRQSVLAKTASLDNSGFGIGSDADGLGASLDIILAIRTITLNENLFQSQGTSRAHLIVLDTINGEIRRERGGAQCQSHDHGQHSCNDLLHVCFLHKNLFVSDLTSPLSPAVYNVNIIML